jgi:all-trans-8'-apo-beta-carotenal 15,15'-oxygenase
VTSQYADVSGGCAQRLWTDCAPGIEKIFAIRPSEESYAVDDIDGRIPAYISGSYYLNGPAWFSRGDFRYRHWLDGDGMVCRLRISPDDVDFANRFVRTNKFTLEQQLGRPVFRTFGTAFPGDALKRGIALESPANVSIYSFHGSLLAFGEQSLPWELNPNTLETIGLYTFGGMLNDMSPFSAHVKFDPKTGEMFNFGTFFSGAQSRLCLYCFEHNGSLRRRASHPMKRPSSIHDFGLTHSYFVFYISPHFLDVNAMTRGNLSLMDALEWHPEFGSELQVFSRDTCEHVASIALPGKYCLHLTNCFEQNEQVVVDVIEFERPVYDQYQPLPDLFSEVSTGGPVRFIVDLHSKTLVSRQEIPYRLAPDFPTLNPALATEPYDDFWMLGVSQTGRSGRKFFDELVHVRWDQPQPISIFRAQPGCYLCGEPIYLGDPHSNEGAVICQEYNAKREESSFLIFDARHVGDGPEATLRLKHPINLGFHASFSPSYTSSTLRQQRTSLTSP